jgi:thiamine kinase-like enzyme
VHSRAGDLKVEPFPLEEVQALIDETLEKLEKDSDGYVDVKFYQGVLERHMKAVSQTHVPVGLLHDDFHYSNILITPDGRACALDYAFTNRGPIYADISTMLIDPETRLAQILSLNTYLSKKRLAQLRSLFLDNYFQGQPYDEQVLNLFCAVAVLYKWSVDERRFSDNGHRQFYFPMLRSVIRRHFQNVFKSYLN